MSGTLTLALAAILWAAGYTIALRVWPFINCRRCHGSGKSRSPSGRAFRRCPRCKGSGRKLRLGRVVLNHYSEAARKAKV